MRLRNGLNLTYSLVETLGQAIVVGDYDRGFPTEAELEAKFTASRSITREAVKMLTAKNLLTARPRHGISVQPEENWNLLDPDVLRWLMERKFSLRLLAQFTELRLGIEPAAAALAARKPDSAALDSIRAGLDRMRAAAVGDDNPLAADIAFHVAILDATENPFYVALREMVNTALHISIRFTNRTKGHTASIPAHEAVFAAIADGDSSAAFAAMHEIIAEVMELIRSA